MLGDNTFSQLSDRDILHRDSIESNSIAIIVYHLYGNMMSRWTDFFTTDGEKESRDRDREFEEVIRTKAEMLDYWEKGWACLFSAVDSIDSTNINQPIYIRQQEHSIIEALNRQMMHYAYHVGQIVFIGLQSKGKNWKSLSIPRGASQKFNELKSSRGMHAGHFTDDWVKEV